MAKSLAAGRAPKKDLEAARRHLAECARCRAAVVAAARGVQGPGDTVLMKRSDGSVPKAFKLTAVLASVLAVGAAWRFGASPKPETPLAERSAHAALEPAPTLVSPGSAPASASVAPSASPLPAATPVAAAPAASPAPEPVVSSATPDEQGAQPIVRILKPLAADDPAPATAIIPPPRATKRPAPARPAAGSMRPASPRAASPRAASMPAEPAPAVRAREYDFGIDDAAAAPARRKLPVRTTLD